MKKDQDIILKAAQEVAPYQRKPGRDNEEKQIAELVAKGKIVTRDIHKESWYDIIKILRSFIAAS